VDRARSSTQRKVLLVEDDSAVARVLKVCLRRAGFDATEVESGGEALRSLDACAFDAVVLDLGLPDGLGGAVLRKLQDAPPASYPVWVIISALDEDEAVRRHGPLKGPFIPKPFDPWDLIGKLEQLWAESSPSSERPRGEHSLPAD